jgi:Family of unknown function (DUF6174)
MKRATLLVLAVLAAGCGDSNPGGPLGFETLDDRRATLAALGAARRLWNAQAASDYMIDFQRTCFCLERLPVRLFVSQGRIRRVVRRDTGAALPASAWEPYLSVEQLFDFLEERARGGAYEVRVRFDPQYGYPADVWVDSDRQLADEEVGFTLANYSPTFRFF